MKKFGLMVAVMLFALPMLASAQDKVLKMSTTTSTESSGLLDVLLPEFKKDTGIEVKVVAKGTGAAIRDGVDLRGQPHGPPPGPVLARQPPLPQCIKLIVVSLMPWACHKIPSVCLFAITTQLHHRKSDNHDRPSQKAARVPQH